MRVRQDHDGRTSCREQTSDKRRDTRTSPVGNGSRKHLAYCVSQSENEEEVGYLAQDHGRTWQHLQNLDIASTQIEAGVQQPGGRKYTVSPTMILRLLFLIHSVLP